MRAEVEPGKLGSCFSFYFYLGTQVCCAEAPGGHTAFPSWSQIQSEHYLPFPVTVPDLQVEYSITRGSGTSSWLLVCCGRREGAGEQLCRPGPLVSSCSEAGTLHHR